MGLERGRKYRPLVKYNRGDVEHCTIALSYVMQKCDVRHAKKATIYTSEEEFAVNRANARGVSS